MTAEARTDSQAALEILRDLQRALADAKMRFPEMIVSDSPEGDIRINLGRVGIGTAARLARIVDDRKRGRRRRMRTGAADGWLVGGLLALCVGLTVAFVVVAAVMTS